MGKKPLRCPERGGGGGGGAGAAAAGGGGGGLSSPPPPPPVGLLTALPLTRTFADGPASD